MILWDHFLVEETGSVWKDIHFGGYKHGKFIVFFEWFARNSAFMSPVKGNLMLNDVRRWTWGVEMVYEYDASQIYPNQSMMSPSRCPTGICLCWWFFYLSTMGFITKTTIWENMFGTFSKQRRVANPSLRVVRGNPATQICHIKCFPGAVIEK